MPHYGVLREHKLEEVDDVRGAEVYGVNDEKLGTIDDVIFDHSNGEIRYIVLEAGGLLSRKRIMVPANRIEPYGHHDDKFYAELDKQRLEMLPEFNDEMLKSEGDWSKFEKDYEDRWNQGAVMYNKDTGHIVTPASAETVQPSQSRPLSPQARESLNRDFTLQKLGKQDDYLGVASGNDKTTLRPAKPSIAGREDAIRQNAGQRNVGQPDLRQENIRQQDVGRQNDAGRENAGQPPQQRTREIEGTMGTEFQVSSSPASSPTEAIREPGVYKLDPVPEAGKIPPTEKKPAAKDTANYGRRWIAFQQRLRERRDKVVSGCTLCGTQEKVA